MGSGVGGLSGRIVRVAVAISCGKVTRPCRPR